VPLRRGSDVPHNVPELISASDDPEGVGRRFGDAKMSLRGFYKILLASLLLFACEPAFAGKRVALMLGNSSYQNVPRLTNPVNDAALMADTFKKAGFDVVVAKPDLGALETRRVLRDFADSAAGADIAVIYYAGHGIEV